MATSRPSPARPRPGLAAVPPAAAASFPAWTDRAARVALPALAALACVATAGRVARETGPEPQVWVTALALYLSSLVLAFHRPRAYRPTWTALACLATIVFLSGREAVPGWFGFEAAYEVADLRALHWLPMFAVCLACHGELFRPRPGDARRSAGSRPWTAAVGAAGGLSVALAAPGLFDAPPGWPMLLVASIGLSCAILARELGARPGDARGAAMRARLLPGWPGAPVLASALAFAIVSGAVLWWEDPLRLRGRDGDDAVAVHVER